MDEDYDWAERIAREGEVAEPQWVVHKLAPHHGMDHMIFCPACQCGHGFDSKRWNFNGDMVKPSLLPQFQPGTSVLIHYYHYKLKKNMTCHYHLVNGNMHFCGDCTHEMAGKVVPLEPF